MDNHCFIKSHLHRIDNSALFIGQLILNRPKAINSLNTAMVSEMLTLLREWQADDAIVAVIISGAGSRGFCAGGDIKAMYASAVDQQEGRCVEAELFFETEYQLDFLIHQYNKPVIAWGNGLVMGGGWGLFAGASHRMVFPSSIFSMPEITIALFPDVAAYYYLSVMPHNIGLYCCLTGAQLSASDMLAYGLAEAMLPDQYLVEQFIADLSKHLADTNDKLSIEMTTICIDGLINRVSLTHSNYPEYKLKPYEQIIAETMLSDSSITVYDAIAMHKNRDDYLGENAQRMLLGSPLCFANVHYGYTYCKGRSLGDIFEHNLYHAIRVVRHPEFAEGVRALMIDKDKKPQWLYNCLNDIPESLPVDMARPLPGVSNRFT